MSQATKQQNTIAIDPIVRPAQLAAMMGTSISTVWANVKLGNIPQPIRPLPRVTGWRMSVIAAWLDSRADIAQRPDICVKKVGA
jgi:predicted DNA-binding transcriptional regulator AlpA